MLLDGAGAAKLLDGKQLTNSGAAVWKEGYLVGFNGAVIDNTSAGTFEVQSGYDFLYGLAPAGWGGQGARATFNNEGTFTKTGDTAPSPYDVPITGSGVFAGMQFDAIFKNSGTVNVNSSILELLHAGAAEPLYPETNPPFVTTGNFAGATGTNLRMYHADVAAGAQIVGDQVGLGDSTMAGTLQVSGTTQLVTVNLTGVVNGLGNLILGGPVNLNPSNTSTLNVSSLTFGGGGNHAGELGVLSGPASLVVAGQFHWTGGTILGGGAITANGSMSIDGTDKYLDSRTINNLGSAVWSAGHIVAYNGAVLNNQGTFEAQTGYDILYSMPGVPTSGQGARSTFINAGTFTKSGDTAPSSYDVPNTGSGVFAGTQFDAIFKNSGTVNVNSSIFELLHAGAAEPLYPETNPPFVTTGDFAGATGTNLRMYHADVAAGAQIVGDQVDLGDSTIAGTYDVSGNTVFNNVTFSGTAIHTGDLRLAGIINTSPNSGSIIPTQNFNFSGGGNEGQSPQLTIDIGGATPGNGLGYHDQIDVHGTVNLGGALKVSVINNAVLYSDQPLVIINNDGIDAVMGMFIGLAEGATVTAQSGAQFSISYHGGDGNDVVLTSLVPPPTATSTTTVVAPNAVYDGTPHGATAVVTGSGGLNQPLPVTYEGIYPTNYGPTATPPTDAGSYRATASFAGDTTHSGSSDTQTFVIDKAPSTTSTVGDGPFAYDGTVHFGGSGLVFGSGGLSTGATSLTYSGDQVNAGIYYVTAHYAGDDNHLCSDGNPVAITITPKDLDATGTTENTINIAKAGTITFTLGSVTGIVAGDGSVYDLFNGATFWLRVGGDSGTLYSVTSTATVLANGNIQISWRMSQELYNDLYAELGGATPSDKTLVDFFVRGVSNDGNYEITEDVFARIFQQGKVVFS